MSVDKLDIARVTEWVDAIINQSEEYFLVEVKVLQGNQIQVYVDADCGVAINELACINKTLRKQIEKEELFAEGNFSLEVSSPGLEEPLKKQRHKKGSILYDCEAIGERRMQLSF